MTIDVLCHIHIAKRCFSLIIKELQVNFREKFLHFSTKMSIFTVEKTY